MIYFHVDQNPQYKWPFKVNLDGSLIDVKNTVDFLIDVIEHKYFAIDDKIFSVDNLNIQKNEILSFASELQLIIKLFTKLRMNSNIDFKKVISQKQLLLDLSIPIVDNKMSSVKIFNSSKDNDSPAFTFCINICGYLCFFLQRYYGDRGYMVYDYFAPDFTDICRFSLEDDTNQFIESPFLAYSSFSYEDLTKIASVPSNFSKNAVISTINKTECFKEIQDHLICFLLDILNIYDIFSNDDFYVISDVVTLKLLEYKNNAVNIINRMQVVKRKRKLNHIEELELANLAKAEQSANILCAIHTLLENSFEAKKFFNVMDDDMKDTFRNYPIFNLFKRYVEG
jgi:hypothetical protein